MHPQKGLLCNLASYISTPIAVSVSDLPGGSNYFDASILLAVTGIVTRAALLKSLGVEEITPASSTNKLSGVHLEQGFLQPKGARSHTTNSCNPLQGS